MPRKVYHPKRQERPNPYKHLAPDLQAKIDKVYASYYAWRISLDEMADRIDKILAKEAKKQGVTVEELMRQ